MQGFLFSRPLRPEDVAAFVTAAFQPQAASLVVEGEAV
jgi:EAL domain-containing protein (putative c-di-GMP-specific phosphodiesterase class I)